MTAQNLTIRASFAKSRSMQGLTQNRAGACLRAGILVAAASALNGCITVNAPTEPIVIELNINITQEVIYRLAEDAGNTIDENPDIF